MRFLKTLFSRSINTNCRSLSKRSKTLSLESLEQRIALDASGVRPQLEPVREVHIDNSLVGPDPMVFGKSELVGHGTKSFVITAVAAGSTVEKWDAAANQWRDVSTPPTSSNPRQLLQLLQNRIIQKDDQVRWIPKSTDGVTQKAFEIIGWDDGSETSESEGVNVPDAVENLALDIVGDQVLVAWDPPTSSAPVTNYQLVVAPYPGYKNYSRIVDSSQTNHTFAKLPSPASYAVTIHANSAEGAGEAMTVTLSHASYMKTDGSIVDPILDTSGRVLDFNGPNLKPGAKLTSADLSDADLTDALLTGANLSGGTNLYGAVLDNAVLDGADLRDVVLTNASLKGTDLTRANLYGVTSGGITNYYDHENPTLLPWGTGYEWNYFQWRIVDGYLVGTGADLRGANLSDTYLARPPTGPGDPNPEWPPSPESPGYMYTLPLTPASVMDADLTGANLTGIHVGATYNDATIFPTGFDPSWWAEWDHIKP